MIDFYYLLGGLAYGIFIFQAIGSFISGSGDFDIDIDGDGDIDIDTNSLLSFKGLLHFVMGISTYYMTKDQLMPGFHMSWLDLVYSILLGLLFVIILFLCYKQIIKLNHSYKPMEGNKLIGKKASITLVGTDCYYISVFIGGMTEEFKALSENVYKVGDEVTIKGYRNGIYTI